MGYATYLGLPSQTDAIPGHGIEQHLGKNVASGALETTT